MIALDTNILLRFVLHDDAALAAAARRLIENNQCSVSLLAVAELGYVLVSFYRAKLPDVLAACRTLLALPALEFEYESRLTAALDGVEAGVDWFDALLWAATPAGVALATFDKAFAKRAATLGWDVQVRLPKAGK